MMNEDTAVAEDDFTVGEAAPKAKKPKKVKEPKAPRRGVGTVAREGIREGLDNDEVLAKVMAEFPEAKTTLQSVNWYRGKMRQEGETVPSARDLKKARKAAEEAANEAPAAETATTEEF